MFVYLYAYYSYHFIDVGGYFGIVDDISSLEGEVIGERFAKMQFQFEIGGKPFLETRSNNNNNNKKKKKKKRRE